MLIEVNVTEEQVVQKLVKLRNDLWDLSHKFNRDEIDLMAIELNDRIPFLDVEKTIDDINKLLEDKNVPYNLKLVSKEAFKSMSQEQKNEYISELENNPDRRRKLVHSGKKKQDKATYEYGHSGFDCPHCIRDKSYDENSDSIQINQYTTPKDDYTHWHEDHFCTTCGGTYTIINGL